MPIARRAIALLGGLLVPTLAIGAPLDVVVTDTQGGAIRGARVAVTCGAVTTESKTDAQGRAHLSSESATPSCTVSVSHEGFASVTQPLSAGPVDHIRLHLAPYRDAITVTAPRDFPRSALQSASSAVLQRDQLEAVGRDVADWLRFARMAAGATPGQERVTVDGFASGSLPPRAAVDRITVNLDPFSAEFATPGVNEIDIATRAPDTSFRWNVGGSALGAGGRNPLAPDASADSSSLSLEARGGLRFAPVAFSAEGASSRQASPVPVRAARVGELDMSPDAVSHSDSDAVTVMLFGRLAGAEWRTTYHRDTFRALNVGAGGITLPDAAWDAGGFQEEVRITIRGQAGRVRYRGGVGDSSSRQHAAAHADGFAVRVLGSLAASAAEASLDDARRRTTEGKAVISLDTAMLPTEFGALVARTRIQLNRQPNPYGTLIFSTLAAYESALANGAPTGILFRQVGPGSVALRATSASVFAQTYLRRGTRGFLRAGMRADTQTGDAPRWSPRLFGSIERAGFTFSSGIGVFTRDYPADLFAQATLHDSAHLREIVLDRAISLVVDPNLRRGRDVIGRLAVSRALGPIEPMLEFTRSRGTRLLGSRRLPSADGWADALTSDYRSTRDQLHARVSAQVRGQQVIGHYEWNRSRDTSAGPFATEASDAGSWAQTAGIAPWRATALVSLLLPRAISVSIAATTAGRVPYDVTSTAVTPDYLFRDRAGLPRNHGRAPGFHAVDLFGSRRIDLPQIPQIAWVRLPREVTVGIQVTNLLGATRYSVLGSVLGTDLFQQPIDALPGRAIRFWMNF